MKTIDITRKKAKHRNALGDIQYELQRRFVSEDGNEKKGVWRTVDVCWCGDYETAVSVLVSGIVRVGKYRIIRVYDDRFFAD